MFWHGATVAAWNLGKLIVSEGLEVIRKTVGLGWSFPVHEIVVGDAVFEESRKSFIVKDIQHSIRKACLICEKVQRGQVLSDNPQGWLRQVNFVVQTQSEGLISVVLQVQKQCECKENRILCEASRVEKDMRRGARRWRWNSDGKLLPVENDRQNARNIYNPVKSRLPYSNQCCNVVVEGAVQLSGSQ